MRQSVSFIAWAALFAAPILLSVPAQAKAGDDHFLILTQGVPGAPVGGTTGDAGNGGVGDHDSGNDRAHTYDTAIDPARDTTSSMSDTTSSMSSTTSGSSKTHRRHSGTNGASQPDSGNNTNTNEMNDDSTRNSGTGNGTPHTGNSY